MFMSQILRGKKFPLGKIVDFFYRVEFQQRGSPHIHLLLWIENAPIFGKAKNEEIQNFVDNHATCSKNDDIAELVNYQTHRHARTCKRGGKNICRFNFPSPPLPETLILEPLNDDCYEKIQMYSNTFKKYVSFLMMHNYYRPLKLLMSFFKS